MENYTNSKTDSSFSFDFSSTYTDNFPKILKTLNISLAITSYQSARLILIRSNEDKIDTRLKVFPRPMGIYADENRITIGTFNQVLEFKRSDELLKSIQNGIFDDTNQYSKKVLEKSEEDLTKLQKERKDEIIEVKKADSLYLHRASLTTGMINIHDIAWGNEGLWVVNSTFSCLSTLNPDSSFIVRWKPSFISELAPEDRCHLNGMALVNGKPKYVTTFNENNEKDSWQYETNNNGTLIDVDTGEFIAKDIIMPHSPKYYKEHIYVCESGRGVVLRIDPKTKVKEDFVKLQGYTRGIKIYKDLMFVCTSKIRRSVIKKHFPLLDMYKETYASVWIVNMLNGKIIASINFTGDVDQIYDIATIPNSIMPELINANSTLTRHLFDYQENYI